MNVLIILIFSTLHAANIREISEIGKEIPDFNKSEDYRSPTDFTDEHRFLCGLGGLEFERVTQISQMTQIFQLPCPPLAKRGPYPTPKPFNSLYDPFGSPEGTEKDAYFGKNK